MAEPDPPILTAFAELQAAQQRLEAAEADFAPHSPVVGNRMILS